MPDKTSTETENDTRRQLLKAVAKALAGSTGLGMPMGELAKRVGVSRPTLYYHFHDKTEIMTSLVEDLIEEANTFISDISETEFASASEQLYELCRRRTRAILESRYNFQILVYLDKNLPDDVREAHEDLKKRVLTSTRDVIARGMANGEFMPGDANSSALAVIGMGNWAAWWFDETRGNAEVVAATLARQSVQSLLAPDGAAHHLLADVDSNRKKEALQVLEDIEAAAERLRASLEG